MSESDDEVNRREVAYRLFAAEFDDADYSYAESDEERAPNYVVTPTGARVNRVFVVGVLTEVEPVNDDVVRARIVDPTGAFVVYAGQYQPEALASLEAAETPSFVAVTGKARTFEPDDADVVYTSIRPEHVSEVDAETRDRWVVTTAEQTVDRVATTAAARDRVERGEDLRRVLEAADVPHGLAAGIPIALDHYGTSPAYLADVRGVALDATRVVAGDLEEVEGLSLAPGEGGDAPLDFADTIDVDVEVGADEPAADTGAETESAEAETEDAEAEGGDAAAESVASATAADESADESAGDESADTTATGEPTTETTEATENESADAEPAGAASTDAAPTEAEAVTDQAESEIVESADAPATDDATEPESDADATETTEAGGEQGASDAEAASPEADPATDEMYELSEEERAEVEENFDVGFSSGSDIPEAGEADLEAGEADREAPEPGEPTTGADADPSSGTEDDTDSDLGTEATDADVERDELGDFDAGPSDDETGVEEGLPDAEDGVQDVDTSEEYTESQYDDAQSETLDDDAATPESEGSASMERDLEDAVVDLMRDLDDGDGAPRGDVVAAATEEYEVDEGDIEDAIQDALMGGRCYESGDDRLKAI